MGYAVKLQSREPNMVKYYYEYIADATTMSKYYTFNCGFKNPAVINVRGHYGGATDSYLMISMFDLHINATKYLRYFQNQAFQISLGDASYAGIYAVQSDGTVTILTYNNYKGDCIIYVYAG